MIQAIVIGGEPYYFSEVGRRDHRDEVQDDVDLSETRAKGHNVFREIGGVRVTADPSDCLDQNPADIYCANKAAGYFPAPLALNAAGEPSMDYVHYSGTKPSVQLVTDFDNNGTADAILVGESIYGRDWWVPGSAARSSRTAPRSTAVASASTTRHPPRVAGRLPQREDPARRLVAGLRCRR